MDLVAASSPAGVRAARFFIQAIVFMALAAIGTGCPPVGSKPAHRSRQEGARTRCTA